MAISTRFVNLPNGQRLHVATDGAGPAILFLHGFPEHWRMWTDAMAHFAPTHRVVAPDQRGYNLSTRPVEVSDYRARHLVEDVLQLADALGIGRFVLVAHDWGGAIAWNVAAWHPDRVERLVIVNAPHPITFRRELMDNPAQQRASAYMGLFRSVHAERVMTEDNYRRLAVMTLDLWGANGGPASEAHRNAWREAWSQPGALTGMLNWYRASPLYPPADGETLAELDPAQFHVRVPTLVIWGERDTALLPCLLDGLEAHVDHLEVTRIPDASHWVMHERPGPAIARMDRFIRGEPPP